MAQTKMLQLIEGFYKSDKFKENSMLSQTGFKAAALTRFSSDSKNSSNLSENSSDVEQQLLETLRITPDSIQTWFALGNFYQQHHKLLEATEAYWQALALKPNSAPIFNNLGLVLHQLGRLNEAKLCYQKALELQPQAFEISVNLGNVLDALGEISSEQRQHLAIANYQLGLSSYEAKSFEAAQLYFQQSISLEPAFTDAYAHLGMTMVCQGDRHSATDCCAKALELDPKHQLAQNCLKLISQRNQSFSIEKPDAKDQNKEGVSSNVSSAESQVKAKSDIEILQKVSVTLVNWAKTGFAIADEATYQKRLQHCMQCPNIADAPPKVIYKIITANQSNEKMCQLCGCIVSKKARIASESCPDMHPHLDQWTRWEEPIQK